MEGVFARMGTAGGEPRVLLNALKPMLGVVGDIKTPQEVMRVVGMMKDAEKLMSRCVYLNILKATCRQAMQNEEKKETLHKFLATGGWGILNKWLMEFTKSENFPVLLELIEVLKVLPITVDLLKQGNTGKLMKSMTKLEHSDVKKNASGLIKQWKNMIRVRELKKKPANEGERADENGMKSDSVKGDDEKKRKASESKQGVSDSSGFMNALNIASPPVKKKRRTSNDTNVKKATLPLDEILKNTTEEPAEVEEKSDAPVDSPEPATEEEDSLSAFSFHSPAVEAANAALAEDTGNVVIDEGSLARKKNKKKRNITWAPDDQLVQVSYFELLEGERKGSHAENFSQARQLELMLEKQAMRAVRRGEDRMVEKVEWRCLIPVDNAGVPNFVPGEKSREKFIQAEREKTVLAYIFLTKQSLPDNPTEPDFDPEDHNNRSHQPTIIPHDEERTILPPRKSSNKSHHLQPMNVTTSQQAGLLAAPQTTQPKQNTPSVPDLVSPAVQNIMTQLLRNNVTTDQQPPQQQQQPQQQPHINNANVPPPNTPNMGPSILGQPGMPQPIMRPPYPNNPPPNMNQPVGNNVNFMPHPPREPVSLMDAPTPSIRGQPRGGGPRFQGGRGFNNGRGGGEVGFNPPSGPGPRPRWNGPPNQGPPPNKRSWDDSNYDNNYHDENYNDNYNENYNYNEKYNDEFRGGHNENGYGRPGPKDGFRNGGLRGRGGFGRGDHSHRGRGGRGRGNDRDRYNGNDWGYDNRNGSRDRRNGDWNRDDRNYGHGSNRGRDHRNNGRDPSRPRDDRGKGNKR